MSHVPAPDPRVQAAIAAFKRGAADEAVPLMREAADDGHPLAQLAVAEWLALGSRLPQDRAGAKTMAESAARAGLTQAMQLLASLLRWHNPADPAADEWTRRAADAGDPQAQAEVSLWPLFSRPLPDAEPLHDTPYVATFRSLLPIPVCHYLVRAGAQHLKPSRVHDPRTGESRAHPVRRNLSMNFGPTLYDSVLAWVNSRIAMISGTEPSQGEPLAILAYRPGDEYRPHLDCIPPKASPPEDRLAESGQRVKTVLVSLNDSYEGGRTSFTEIGLTWRGATGDALLFTNVKADETPDPLSRHAGQPVEKGEKWLASRWIRARPYVI